MSPHPLVSVTIPGEVLTCPICGQDGTVALNGRQIDHAGRFWPCGPVVVAKPLDMNPEAVARRMRDAVVNLRHRRTFWEGPDPL